MLRLKETIEEFLEFATDNAIEIYNEFSLQHELGIFLRNKIKDYKIQFERNISFFFMNAKTVKHEIDIVIYNHDKSEKYAIELKYPTDSQYPEKLYSFIKDIKFMEQLKELGFNKTYCVTIFPSEYKKFYDGADKRVDGIYKYFRKENSVYGKVNKPTGALKEIEYIELNNKYDIVWQDTKRNEKYYLIEM